MFSSSPEHLRHGTALEHIIVLGDGKPPHTIPARFHYVEGLLHKVVLPGIEIRSGESLGISATFTVVADMYDEGDRLFGRLNKLTIHNGRLVDSQSAGIVELPPAACRRAPDD